VTLQVEVVHEGLPSNLSTFLPLADIVIEVNIEVSIHARYAAHAKTREPSCMPRVMCDLGLYRAAGVPN
jgi:hypothetical protein